MNAHEIGKKLVQLCREGKDLESLNTLCSADIVSVEAAAPSGGDRAAKGLDALRGKHTWWRENHEIHSTEAHGPYPHGEEKFAVRFLYDVTNKPSGQRFKLDEIAVYEVRDGKIVREEFFYTMG